MLTIPQEYHKPAAISGFPFVARRTLRVRRTRDVTQRSVWAAKARSCTSLMRIRRSCGRAAGHWSAKAATPCGDALGAAAQAGDRDRHRHVHASRWAAEEDGEHRGPTVIARVLAHRAGRRRIGHCLRLAQRVRRDACAGRPPLGEAPGVSESTIRGARPTAWGCYQVALRQRHARATAAGL